MSGLFGSASPSSTVTRLTSLQVSSSIYGATIAVVYGTNRVPSNLADYADFEAHEQEQNNGKGGGAASSYTYTAAVIEAICEGPITGIGKVWQDKDVYTLAGSGFSMLSGGRPQAAWGTWASKHPDRALGYSGTALVCNARQDLGAGGSTPNFNFEVVGLFAGSSSGTITVSGKAMPWSLAGGKNAAYPISATGTSPVAVAVVPGQAITLSATGAVSYNSGGATVGPDGANINRGGNTTTPPSYYAGHDATSNDMVGLVGAFADASGNVIKPVWIGSAASLVAPAGATQLLLGVNDCRYDDNGGSFTVSIPSATNSGADAFADLVIGGMLGNPYYGIGWDASRIADMTSGDASYRRYCVAAGFFVSPAFTDQQATSGQLQTLLDATNAEIVWHATAAGMVLKIVPYGDAPITGNGITYTPDTAPIYDITYDDILGVIDERGTATGESPIAVTLTSVQDIKNCVPVEYVKRSNDYNTATEQEPDFADVSINGMKTDGALTLHCITNQAHAQAISKIRAQRNVYVRRQYTVRVSWRLMCVEPMDLVTISDPLLGLSYRICRVISVEYPDETGESEGITLTLEDWPLGIGSATKYPSGSGSAASSGTSTGTGTGSVSTAGAGGSNGNTSGSQLASTPPGNTNAPVIFEPPALLSGSGKPEIWIGASGGANWGGCYVWISTDGGSSYSKVATISGKAKHGTLTAALASVADPDTTSTLAVDLAVSGGTLTGTDANGLAAWATASLVGDEIVAFRTATLTGANAYSLTTLRRGGYGSGNAAHAVGTRFMLIDSAVAKITYDESLAGKTLYIKCQSYNNFSTAVQDLADVTAVAFVPQGVEYPQPTTVTVTTSTTKPSVAANDAQIIAQSWTDGIDYNAGSPNVVGKVWVDIAWAFSSTASAPDYFEVVLISGSDPTDPSTYLIEPARVDGDVRRLVLAVTPNANISSINACVRAVYA
jgi:hypothetical protein